MLDKISDEVLRYIFKVEVVMSDEGPYPCSNPGKVVDCGFGIGRFTGFFNPMV
ncbi:MAG: hypothetical protein IPP25_08350 [Saprospiraceae bacterium]|nr:hypothetical protein [Candidatus Opimibacter skivensis]